MQATTAIENYLTHLADTGASRSTVRQRRWALDQALTAAALATVHGPAPSPDLVAATDPHTLARARAHISAGDLTSEQFSTWFGPWAATGALADPTRTRTLTSISGASTASARARIAALRALADHLGSTAPTHTHAPQHMRPVPPKQALDDLLRLLPQASGPGRERARIEALISIMTAAPAGPSSLTAMRAEHVVLDDEATVWLDHPPDGGPAIALPEGPSRAVAKWLTVRTALHEALSGSAPDALWVAVRAHQSPGGILRPAGMALQPRGIERAYSRAVRKLNLHLAENPEHIPHSMDPAFASVGAVPVSGSLELLRRALVAAGYGQRSGWTPQQD